MNNDLIHHKMDATLALLKTAPSFNLSPDYIESKRLTKRFMNNTLDLYLALKLDPLMELKPEFQRYLEQSADLLRSRILEFFTPFFQDLDDVLSSGFQDSEWTIVCKMRSALEAVKEMYHHTSLKDYLQTLESEELDNAIRQRGQRDGYIPVEQIPIGIPESHWWWWLAN